MTWQRPPRLPMKRCLQTIERTPGAAAGAPGGTPPPRATSTHPALRVPLFILSRPLPVP